MGRYSLASYRRFPCPCLSHAAIAVVHHTHVYKYVCTYLLSIFHVLTDELINQTDNNVGIGLSPFCRDDT